MNAITIEEILLEAAGLNIRQEVIDSVNSIGVPVPEHLEPKLYDLVLECYKEKYTTDEPIVTKDFPIEQETQIEAAIEDLAQRLNVHFAKLKDVDIVVPNWQLCYMFLAELLPKLDFQFKLYNVHQYELNQDVDRHVIVVNYEEHDLINEYVHSLGRHLHDVTEVYLLGPNTKRIASAITYHNDGTEGEVQGYGKPDHENRWSESKNLNLVIRV